MRHLSPVMSLWMETTAVISWCLKKFPLFCRFQRWKCGGSKVKVGLMFPHLEACRECGVHWQYLFGVSRFSKHVMEWVTIQKYFTVDLAQISFCKILLYSLRSQVAHEINSPVSNMKTASKLCVYQWILIVVAFQNTMAIIKWGCQTN